MTKAIADVVVVGGGPGGSAAAWAAAQAGLSVVLCERTVFPRPKVCGDCLNPALHESLRKMGVAEALELAAVAGGPWPAHAAGSLAHCRRIEFHRAKAEPYVFQLPPEAPPEVVVQRRDFDALLLGAARRADVDVRENVTVEKVVRTGAGWQVRTSAGEIATRCLIAADGRNSTVARSLHLLTTGRQHPVGWQRHVPLPTDLRETIAMFFLPSGYGGLADCGGGEANLCLVATPRKMAALTREVAGHFGIEVGEKGWQTIAPIRRAPARRVATNGVFLVGDTARVVEPFTGEGIYYAVRSGLLAGEAVGRELLKPGDGEKWYVKEHRALYRGRRWINELSRMAGEQPQWTAHLMGWPGVGRYLLPLLTRKVVVPPEA